MVNLTYEAPAEIQFRLLVRYLEFVFELLTALSC